MPWSKGESGNPKGRKMEKVARDLSRKHGPRAIEIIAELMENADRDAVRADCAQYIADRAYGKAKQQVEVAGEEGGPIKTLTQVIISVLDTQARPSAIDVTPEPIAIPSTNKEDA